MRAPGELIAQRYRLRRLVGAGGMGVVWEAFDERLHRTVALKQLHPQPWLSDAEAEVVTHRALREARITARLNHAHAVPVYDVVEDQGLPCLVMQFLPSEPLSSVLQRGGTLPEPEVVELGAQLASALTAAHRVGIVHRDVKPGNVLVTVDGMARISDFGIAHALGDVTVTATGLVAGTPEYLAPEVARGDEPGFPADVFSLGATLYAALEGGPPFGTDTNRIALLHRVAAGVLTVPQRGDPLTSLLRDMLAADPGDRPTMSDVAARLEGMRETGRAPEHTPVGAAAGLATEPTAPRATVGMPVRSEDLSPTVGVPARRGQEPAPAAGRPPPPSGVPFSAQRQQEPGPAASAVTAPPLVRPAGPSGTGASARRSRPKGRRRRPPASGRRSLLAILAVLVLAGPLLLLVQSWRDDGQVAALATPSASTPASPTQASSSATPTAAPFPPAAAPAAPSPAAPPATSAPSPPASAAPPVAAAGALTPADSVRTISSYYSLLPARTDQAWPLMTASYQADKAGGRAAYQRFWDAYSRVTATEVSAVGPSTVEATISYYAKDGGVIRERTQFALVNDGGVVKIATSRVLRTLGS